jgi:predicted RNA-binding protein with RPS1 domain
VTTAESISALDSEVQLQETDPSAADQPPAESVDLAPAATAAAPGEKPAAGQKPQQGKKKVKTIPRQKIVKVLSVGMEVTGKVKRTSDFGAFVDIGVGRDGLLHISEMSTGRVRNVTDVVKEGDEITVWIKQLDREKNRISLTMVSPETKTIRDLSEGDLVNGTVQRLTNYGAFVDIGLDRDAMLHVKEMADGYVAKPEDVVKVGDEIEARIIGLDTRRGRIDLSLKGLRPAADVEVEVALEPVTVDPEMDEDLPTLMEMAFRQAFDADSGSGRDRRRRKGSKARREYHDDQDDIISRTLRYQQGRG